MPVKSVQTQNTGMTLVITFLVMFTVNSLVVYLASVFFPGQVVLGTQHITAGWALIHAIGSLALINTFAIPFIREFEKMKGRMLTPKEWVIDYFFINLVGVWVLARFAEQLGFGISSWVVAVVLAVVLDAAQGMAMMQVEKYRAKNS
jgi:hypothetical protein